MNTIKGFKMVKNYRSKYKEFNQSILILLKIKKKKV